MRVTVSDTVPSASTTLATGDANCTVLSSSRIVTVTLRLAPMEASPTGVPNPTVNVSVGSTTVSLRMVRMMFVLAWLVANVTVALVTPAKSEPASAVPLVVL